MSQNTLGQRLIDVINPPPEVRHFYRAPDPGEGAWADLIASIPAHIAFRRLTAGLALFVLLERQGAATRQDIDPLLTQTIADAPPNLVAELGAPLMALFESLPPARLQRLRQALTTRGLQLAIANHDRADAICAGFKDEALALLMALLDEGVEGQPHRIRLPGEDSLRWGSAAMVLIWLLEGREAPPPRWMTERAEAELRLRLGVGLHGCEPAFVEMMRWMPEARRADLILGGQSIPWEAIALVSDPQIAHHAIDIFVKAPERQAWRHLLIPSDSTLPWASAIAARIAETSGEHRQLLDAQLNIHARPADLPILLPLVDGDDEELRAIVQRIFFKAEADEAVALVEAALDRDPTPAQVRWLARALAWFGLWRGQIAPIEALLARSRDPHAGEALQAALDRSRPDWDALAQALGPWLDGDLRVENEARQADLVALRARLDRWRALSTAFPCKSFLALEGFDPIAILATLEIDSASTPRTVTRHFDAFTDQLGPHFAGAARALLERRPLGALSALYARALEKPGLLDDAHHLRALAEGSGGTQRLASRALAEVGERALDPLLDLLSCGKADVRAAAATSIHLIGARRALGPLRAALAGERSAKVKKALEGAIAACDPVEVAFKAAAAGSLGTWRRGDPLTLHEGLERLRELLYDPPTAISWVKLCDTLQRLRLSGGLDDALDYLQGHDAEGRGVDRWPEADRALPWGWEDDPRLMALGRRAAGPPWWLPVSGFYDDAARGGLLSQGLAALQTGPMKRRLPMEQVEDFMRHLDGAWAWCEAHGVGLDKLEVRLDGGAYKGLGRPGTTSLELWRHFGVLLDRGPAFSGHTGPAGMRWVRVLLDKDDLLRDAFGAPIGARHLDLRPILDA